MGLPFLLWGIGQFQTQVEDSRSEYLSKKQRLLREQVEEAFRRVESLTSQLSHADRLAKLPGLNATKIWEAVVQIQVLRRLQEQQLQKGKRLICGRYDGHVLLGLGAGHNMLLEGDAKLSSAVQSLIATSQKGGGYLDSPMPTELGGDPVASLSYVRPIKGFNGFLGASISLQDFDTVIETEKNRLIASLLPPAGIGLSFLGALLLGAFLYARYLGQKASCFVGGLSTDSDQLATLSQARPDINTADAAALRPVADSVSKQHRTENGQEQGFFHLLHELPIATALVRDDGSIPLLNQHFVSLFGYAPEQIRDLESWYQLAFPCPKHRQSQRQEWERLFRQARATGTHIENLPGQIQAADGTLRFIEAKVTVLEKHCLLQVQDRTPLVLKQQQLEQTQELLAQSQKLGAIGKLAGGVAHDFNNYLMPILASTELLEGALQDQELRNSVGTISRAASRAASLTQQLLSFTRKDPLEHRAVDAHSIIEEVLRLLQSGLPCGINIEAQLLAKSHVVMANPAHLSSALLNLGMNACDAISGSGCIRYRTRVLTREEHPELTQQQGLSQDAYLEISVEDDGCGIAEEHIHRVFDPFFTTKERGKGTGLGLSTLSERIREMGGSVRIESVPEHGSCFFVLLPLTDLPSSAAAASECA